jgi:DnaJ-class molecular chaperone
MGKPGRHSSLEECPSCIGDDGYTTGQVADKDTGDLRQCRTCNGGGTVLKDREATAGGRWPDTMKSTPWVIGKGFVSPTDGDGRE